MNRVNASKRAWWLAGFLFVIGSLWANVPIAAEESDQPMIGQPAPSFSLLDLDDQRISSDDLRGSYLVIHVAASW
ncbi:MAG: hypothetical protein OEV49_05580 [candidate division Zixibacteria bacterium]|nr:hypothetical protein [candidate division Zixibacteria bacterium]MDH3936233.1 hypothetical protein [candidate division Zixibacteria bacterium]MDH4035010.1 hypothetical protein [candidate division Zixibacteria bacterium]